MKIRNRIRRGIPPALVLVALTASQPLQAQPSLSPTSAPDPVPSPTPADPSTAATPAPVPDEKALVPDAGPTPTPTVAPSLPEPAPIQEAEPAVKANGTSLVAAVPSNLRASVNGSGHVELAWDVPSPRDENGFKVERAQGSGWVQLARITDAGGLRSYTDSTRDIAKNARYRVRSFIANVVNSAYSNEAIIYADRYEATPAISAGRVLYSGGGEVRNGVLTVVQGQQLNLSVESPSDFDNFYHNGVMVSPHRPEDQDNLYFDWKGSGFSAPRWSDSNGTLWTAPTVTAATTVTITVEVNDTQKNASGTVIGGRPAGHPRNDTPITRTLQVRVLPKKYTISADPSGLTPGNFVEASKPEWAEFTITLKASTDIPNPPSSVKFFFRRPKNGDTASLTAEATSPGKYEATWTVTKWQGKWNIKIDPQFGTSNVVQVKIDKRRQITRLARSWADVWPSLNYQHGTIGYPEVLPPIPHPVPTQIFSGCDGFTGYIYGALGLVNQPGGLSVLPLDSGLGALRGFRLRKSSATSPGYGHVAIVVPNGNMIDVNNANDATGPTLRSSTWGTGPLGQYWGGSNPTNRGYPDPGNPDKTQLQVLDEE